LTSLIQLSQRDTSAESRFQLLIEAVIDYAIFILDPEGHIVSWNSGAEKIKGWRADEIIGQHFSVFYPPDALERGWPQEELRRAELTGRIQDEGWRVRKDGTRFWANVTITAVHDESGQLAGYAKVTRDMTERRAYEEELRASEERFRLMVEGVRDYAIFMLDPEGIVRSWNAGAQAIKGYESREIIGRPMSTFYTPQDQQDGKPARQLAQAREKGRVEDEGWRVRKDGSLFWANVVVTAIYNRTGQLVGYGKVTRDMTDRRRLEELERSSRMMSEFLAMLAHELRNPLAPMRNAVSVMQLEPMTSPALRNCRDIIDRQLTHVTRLVDDLLDIGRLTTGKIKLRHERMRLEEVVERSVETVRPLLETRRHSLALELPPHSVQVMGDGTRLSQILQNLLINAAKYTPDGGHITVKVEQSDGLVTTSVSDNGRGLGDEDLESIFELFRQGSHGTATESGLGIGLTLARSLAEMHGGSLHAASPGPGQGSTFFFRIPAAPMQPGETPSLPRQHQADAWRVLVVDDNRDSADTTTAILRLLGNQVECAYSGLDALDLAQRFKAHVVLLDLAMPGMDGFVVLRELRKVPGLESVFGIAMTGYGSQDDQRRTQDAGFDAHLIKPVELDALIQLLNDARARAAQARGH
jgi:PAS domain S-box-containing protein